MACETCRAPEAPDGAARKPGGAAPTKSFLGKRKSSTSLAPGLLAAQLQSRQLINSMRLRPSESGSSGSAVLPPRATTASTASSSSGGLFGSSAAQAAIPAIVSRTYVPVRTLPLIFAQRKRHLQQQKSRAAHAEPYQRRAGHGLLALPEDVLLKVVCSLTHDELKPLFQVCKALRSTLRNAVAYHFNYSTPSRLAGGGAPPALGERQRRPARTNHLQVISRLARGGRGMAGRGAGRTARSAAPRALDFADAPPSSSAPVQAMAAAAIRA